MEWTIEEIICAVNGRVFVVNKYKTFNQISIDSREIAPGAFFVAINGENYKGACFLKQAVSRGACGVLLERNDVNEFNQKKIRESGIACILVEDTVQALGDLAKYHRNRVKVKVVAITGSVGKTTTRQMAMEISSQRFSTVSTKGNMNNLIGLPLTLLKVEPYHRVAILELGMSQFGEIGRLGEICQPDIGIITNVAPTHLETLGSMENIFKAKMEIMVHIKPDGFVVLNADDPFAKLMSKKNKVNKFFFGTNYDADIQCDDLVLTNKGGSFLLRTPLGCCRIKLPLPSKAIMSNMLAASAVGVLLHCSNEEIKIGIERFKLNSSRMKTIKTGVDGIELIDDTYNSNPISLDSAIETLSFLKKDRFTIAILGDMLELGEQAKSMHYEAGRVVSKAGIDRLYATGIFAKFLVEGAHLANMDLDKIYMGSKNAILKDIKDYLKKECIVLVKASRGMKMDIVVKKILKILKEVGMK